MHRRDEIGQVATAFDSMVASLQRKQEEIQRIVSELRESEERYRLLTENALAYIFMIRDGRLIYVNQRILHSFGYTYSEMAGAEFLDFVHPEDRTEILRKKRPQNPETSTTDQYEFRCRTKTGETRWLEVLTVPMAYQGGQAFLGHGLDITERKAAQEEQAKLEAQLKQAHKMEAIGTLMGAVAHDLNNILSGLVSYPDLLLMRIGDDSPLRKTVLTIQKSGQKAAAVVQDLLTMARRGIVVKQPVELNGVIREYLKSPEFQSLARYHQGISFKTDLEPNLRNVCGSSLHISKTIMNLTANASEAMPEGGTVSISTTHRRLERPLAGYEVIPAGEYAVLGVKDTGIGIPGEDLERIFEPFYTKKIMGRSGTGLGMAVVWSTVKDNHGYIDIQSHEGSGTCFDLYFPVTRDPMISEPPQLSVDTCRGNERILVVDDMEEQRTIARAMLNQLGYQVTALPSGEAAVEYIKTHAVDLLILDMIMDPGIDGLETYQRILAIRPDQKAIIASGFSETDRIRHAQALGVGTVLFKPYTLAELAAGVRKALDGAGSAAERN